MDKISHEMPDLSARLNALASGRYWLAHDGLDGRVQTVIDVVRLGPGEQWDGRNHRAGVYWIEHNRLEPIARLARLPHMVLEPVPPGSVMAEGPDHDALHRRSRKQAG